MNIGQHFGNFFESSILDFDSDFDLSEFTQEPMFSQGHYSYVPTYTGSRFSQHTMIPQQNNHSNVQEFSIPSSSLRQHRSNIHDYLIPPSSARQQRQSVFSQQRNHSNVPVFSNITSLSSARQQQMFPQQSSYSNVPTTTSVYHPSHLRQRGIHSSNASNIIPQTTQHPVIYQQQQLIFSNGSTPGQEMFIGISSYTPTSNDNSIPMRFWRYFSEGRNPLFSRMDDMFDNMVDNVSSHVRYVDGNVDFVLDNLLNDMLNVFETNPQPLPKEKIRKLKKMKFKEITEDLIGHSLDNVCSICQEKYESNSIVTILTCPGNHYYHTECIKKWLSKYNKKCPICRENLD